MAVMARSDSNGVHAYLGSKYVHLVHLHGLGRLKTDALRPLMIGVAPTYLHITRASHKTNVYRKGPSKPHPVNFLPRIETLLVWKHKERKKVDIINLRSGMS